MFLASDAAAFVTGHTLVVDGGMRRAVSRGPRFVVLSASPERIRQSCFRMNSTLPPGSWHRTRSGSRSSGVSVVAFAHQLAAASFAEAAVLPPLPFAEKKPGGAAALGLLLGGLGRGLLLLCACFRPVCEYLSISALLASSSSRIGQPSESAAARTRRQGGDACRADRKAGPPPEPRGATDPKSDGSHRVGCRSSLESRAVAGPASYRSRALFARSTRRVWRAPENGHPESSPPDSATERDPRILFFQGFLRRPSTVGSVIPSSRYLERRVVRAARLATAQLVVELGPGTGGTTRAILRALPADAKLLSIEINPDFLPMLRAIARSAADRARGQRRAT